MPQDGVAKSDVFVLFLTKGVFTRPYVQLEVSEALRLKSGFVLNMALTFTLFSPMLFHLLCVFVLFCSKPFILIHEADERHGKFDFNPCACGSAGERVQPAPFAANGATPV